MSDLHRAKRARRGQIERFTRSIFSHAGVSHPVYRKGLGPAVIVTSELPGISPEVLGFADHVVDVGCSVALPDLFGVAGAEAYAPNPLVRAGYTLRALAHVCISREFNLLGAGRSSPVTDWLRALAAAEHLRAGGPGVGVVGMCFTGGFALALAVDPHVLAPVLAQPSLPLGLSAAHKRNVDCAPAALDRVAERCAAEGLRVLGLRFKDDPFVPDERFEFLRERLGDGFEAIELEQADGHPHGPLPKHHSVLTHDLIDEPHEPTRRALDRVLALFRRKLLVT